MLAIIGHIAIIYNAFKRQLECPHKSKRVATISYGTPSGGSRGGSMGSMEPLFSKAAFICTIIILAKA